MPLVLVPGRPWRSRWPGTFCGCLSLSDLHSWTPKNTKFPKLLLGRVERLAKIYSLLHLKSRYIILNQKCIVFHYLHNLSNDMRRQTWSRNSRYFAHSSSASSVPTCRNHTSPLRASGIPTVRTRCLTFFGCGRPLPSNPNEKVFCSGESIGVTGVPVSFHSFKTWSHFSKMSALQSLDTEPYPLINTTSSTDSETTTDSQIKVGKRTTVQIYVINDIKWSVAQNHISLISSKTNQVRTGSLSN